MAEKTMTLMFNKGNGHMIGGFPIEDAPTQFLENVRYKTLTYDPDTHAYVGDYATGSIMPIIEDDNTTIDEESLDFNVGEKIQNTYPIYKQLNIIMDVLANNNDIVKTKAFNQMKAMIDDERNQNIARKNTYKESDTPYNFISKEDAERDVLKRLEEE